LICSASVPLAVFVAASRRKTAGETPVLQASVVSEIAACFVSVHLNRIVAITE
jgi:hypothetical protein